MFLSSQIEFLFSNVLNNKKYSMVLESKNIKKQCAYIFTFEINLRDCSK